MCIKCDTIFLEMIDMSKENKNELIHIRIEPTVKEKSEIIFNKLGINMSYAISLFLNQVILKKAKDICIYAFCLLCQLRF